MTVFDYKEVFSISEDSTEYRFISSDYIDIDNFFGKKIVKIGREGIEFFVEHAFIDVSHFYRSSQLSFLAKILNDPYSSKNDRYVALEFIKNAVISAECEFPMCQDTGTAIVIGKKGQRIWTDFYDEMIISKGIYNAYKNKNLRYSQNVPVTMYQEKNTNTNLPAQIELYSVPGNVYEFLFIAKGGGSANKTYLFQATKALLNPKELLFFLKSKMFSIGTSACPPYHMAIVVGGMSAEFNLKTVKLASAGYLDKLPFENNKVCFAFRDGELEKKLLKISQEFGIGAQFGGKYFCHDIRVIRLPRHSASCPIGIGVSCSADRNIKGKINKDGFFLEKLETNPSKFLPKLCTIKDEAVQIDLNQPIDRICQTLTRYQVATRLSLNGKIIVARDIAHAKLKDKLDKGEGIPDYFIKHVIYYAGPAKIPSGYPSGSFGPTTAGRMDPYVPIFQKEGASKIMLAKGNRSLEVIKSCKKYGGFYLGSIGGSAARLGKDSITSVKVVDFFELGMEAIFMITVKNFPAFLLIDDKGNDFFEKFSV